MWKEKSIFVIVGLLLVGFVAADVDWSSIANAAQMAAVPADDFLTLNATLAATIRKEVRSRMDPFLRLVVEKASTQISFPVGLRWISS
jgi:hypothetical protein